MGLRRCLACGSDQLTDTAWRDLVPSMPTIDEILIFDGEKPIPRTLIFCELCGEWLASSAGRKQVDELIAAIRLVATDLRSRGLFVAVQTRSVELSGGALSNAAPGCCRAKETIRPFG